MNFWPFFIQIIVVGFLLCGSVACNSTSPVSNESHPQKNSQATQQEQSMSKDTTENEDDYSEFSTEHWDAEKIAQYKRIVGPQLVMNDMTWQNLQDKGVTEETELRLDFFYFAPDKKSAELLRQFLGRETDYEFEEISFNASNGDWSVNGTTQTTTVSKEILDEWVDYMTAVGVEYNCEFDGWGTLVPNNLSGTEGDAHK